MSKFFELSVNFPYISSTMFRETRSLHTSLHYYPFGLMMSGRSWSEGYRFGFNGQEQLLELLGSTNAYLTETRILDVRLGRWFSVDPLQNRHVEVSPYNSMGCNPIAFVDLDGKENVIYIVILPSAEGKLTIEEQDDIVEKLLYIYNDAYSGLNIPVDVRIFNEDDYGQFNSAYLDPSDIGVLIGSIEEVKSMAKDNVANHINRGVWNKWGNNPFVNPYMEPEISEPDGNYGKKGQIVGVSIDGLVDERSSIGEKSTVELAVYLIFHGAGHNAGIKHGEGVEYSSSDPPDESAFAPGNRTEKYLNNNPDLTLTKIMQSGHTKDYRLQLKEKFTGTKASDNYKSNKVKYQE